MVNNYKNLGELWKYTDRLKKKRFPKNSLKPIFGGGKERNPKIMFVFINPTIKNISSDPSWKGFRAPFIGTKPVWRVFHKAGLLDDKLIEEINNNSNWTVGFAKRVYDFLSSKGIYFTNIVKLTGDDAALPGPEKVKLFLPILKKEIEIVQPKYIIAFGLIPFEHLTKKKIKMGDFYDSFKKNGRLDNYCVKLGSFDAKVIPCYFPVGRGNPARAVEILSAIKYLY